MDLFAQVNRFYLDMVINELRLANYNTYQNITYNSLLYLDIIAYREHCTVSYLAGVLHVAKSAVTLKVKELERLGLVSKVQSTEDKRVFYLSVNETLRQEYKAYDKVLYGALDEIKDTFTAAEISVFCAILDTINHHFETENSMSKGASSHESPHP